MSEIRFRSDVLVRLVPDVCCGSDAAMARAARVLRPAEAADNPGRTLGACLPLKHNSPFEHGLMSVYAEAPGVVWWQLTRQRFMSLDAEDFSFNLESGRYRVLDPEFYLPPDERPCREPDGFRPMRPRFDADAAANAHAASNINSACHHAWRCYSGLVELGVAREVARLCLPNWALYCDGYVTARPLTWLQFFSKRNRTAGTATPTFPQWEIEQFARACEELFAGLFPLTHGAFLDSGREAP